MNDQSYMNEQITRHLIHERVQRASEPHVHTGPRRHRLAESLRRIATRLDA
jgi:hypothetical protein